MRGRELSSQRGSIFGSNQSPAYETVTQLPCRVFSHSGSGAAEPVGKPPSHWDLYASSEATDDALFSRICALVDIHDPPGELTRNQMRSTHPKIIAGVLDARRAAIAVRAKAIPADSVCMKSFGTPCMYEEDGLNLTPQYIGQREYWCAAGSHSDCDKEVVLDEVLHIARIFPRFIQSHKRFSELKEMLNQRNKDIVNLAESEKPEDRTGFIAKHVATATMAAKRKFAEEFPDGAAFRIDLISPQAAFVIGSVASFIEIIHNDGYCARLMNDLQNFFFKPHQQNEDPESRIVDTSLEPGEEGFTGRLIPAPDKNKLKWGEMKIVAGRLKKRSVAAITSKRLRPQVYGAFAKHIHRLPTDKKIFVVPRSFTGGTILVDLSGSMGDIAEHLNMVMEQMPAATVAGYCGDGPHGRLFIFIQRGRRLDTVLERSAGNIVDGPALRWLAKQRRPRIWVSDGGVTGVGDQWNQDLAYDALRIMRSASIVRVLTMELAMECLRDKSVVSHALATGQVKVGNTVFDDARTVIGVEYSKAMASKEASGWTLPVEDM